MVAATTEVSERDLTVPPMTKNRRSQLDLTLQQACLAARALEDTRGQDVLVLDLTGVTSIVDFFVLATGSSPRQMKAMAEEVHKVLKQSGSRRIGYEGEDSSQWLLQDYGDLVIHLFSTDARKLYDLEHLWAEAPRIDWKAIAPPVTPRV
jgi:ribosome-associated protein